MLALLGLIAVGSFAGDRNGSTRGLAIKNTIATKGRNLQTQFLTGKLKRNLFFDQKSVAVDSVEHVSSKNALHLQTITLHYADADKMENLLSSKSRDLLSKRGRMAADPRTNTLWVVDFPQNIKRIEKLIKHLDVAVQQVAIKARIVDVDDNYVSALGIEFKTSQVANTEILEDGLSLNFPFKIPAANKLVIPITKSSNGAWLDLELSALVRDGHAQVVSKPELMTSNRQQAVIEAGEEVPYQEKTVSGATSVAFKKAVLRLQVRPIILPHRRILLHLTVNQDKLSALSINGVPAIQTQKLATQVLVRDRQTVVLGGIYEQIASHQSDGIPLLSRLPLFGWLFRHRQRKRERRELLIFVTPRIISAFVSHGL